MLLWSRTGPVSQIPGGITNFPPPFPASEVMAWAMALVLRVLPSPVPPKSARFTTFAGMAGSLTFGIWNPSANACTVTATTTRTDTAIRPQS